MKNPGWVVSPPGDRRPGEDDGEDEGKDEGGDAVEVVRGWRMRRRLMSG